jgi:hypothetical protein
MMVVSARSRRGLARQKRRETATGLLISDEELRQPGGTIQGGNMGETMRRLWDL